MINYFLNYIAHPMSFTTFTGSVQAAAPQTGGDIPELPAFHGVMRSLPPKRNQQSGGSLVPQAFRAQLDKMFGPTKGVYQPPVKQHRVDPKMLQYLHYKNALFRHNPNRKHLMKLADEVASHHIKKIAKLGKASVATHAKVKKLIESKKLEKDKEEFMRKILGQIRLHVLAFNNVTTAHNAAKIGAYNVKTLFGGSTAEKIAETTKKLAEHNAYIKSHHPALYKELEHIDIPILVGPDALNAMTTAFSNAAQSHGMDHHDIEKKLKDEYEKVDLSTELQEKKKAATQHLEEVLSENPHAYAGDYETGAAQDEYRFDPIHEASEISDHERDLLHMLLEPQPSATPVLPERILSPISSSSDHQTTPSAEIPYTEYLQNEIDKLDQYLAQLKPEHAAASELIAEQAEHPEEDASSLGTELVQSVVPTSGVEMEPHMVAPEPEGIELVKDYFYNVKAKTKADKLSRYIDSLLPDEQQTIVDIVTRIYENKGTPEDKEVLRGMYRITRT